MSDLVLALLIAIAIFTAIFIAGWTGGYQHGLREKGLSELGLAGRKGGQGSGSIHIQAVTTPGRGAPGWAASDHRDHQHRQRQEGAAAEDAGEVSVPAAG